MSSIEGYRCWHPRFQFTSIMASYKIGGNFKINVSSRFYYGCGHSNNIIIF